MDIAASTITGWPDPGIAIAASRSGALGVLNLAHVGDVAAARDALQRLAQHGKGRLAVKLAPDEPDIAGEMLAALPPGVDLVIATAADAEAFRRFAAAVRVTGRSLWLECTSLEHAELARAEGVSGLIAKGHEAGGFVGEETTFILLQRLLARSEVPVWARGGIGLHTAAACLVAGASGVVLESQLALTPEAGLPEVVQCIIEGFDGSETACVGAGLGDQLRAYRAAGSRQMEELQALAADASGRLAWRQTIRARVGWGNPACSLWLLGQDAAFAAPLARQYKNIAGIVKAVQAACHAHVDAARRARSLGPASPLASSHGTRYPIVQGPMTRVSDTPAFAQAVAEGGALPFLALALMRGTQVRALLEEAQARLGARPWGIGILGFVPPDLRQEQLDVVSDFHPPFALIAGGRPDQALTLERRGIATYLHVPAPALLRLFLADGARRFVFEGRECGGHVGPRSSFVLWDTMVDVLLDAIRGGIAPEELHVLFAGGIHDAMSAAMVQAIAGPLAAAGVRVGVLMGTAYLFTEEAVSSGAILDGFQQEALACDRTILLETGPGHVTRCAETPFCETFHRAKRELLAEAPPPEEVRDALERLNVGRLRIASKGITREAGDSEQEQPRHVSVDSEQQRRDGMYMLGQLAALRNRTCRIPDLHEEVSAGSQRLLDRAMPAAPEPTATVAGPPCDVAIVGMSCLLPRAADVSTYWHNILTKVDAITEVPKERFDVDRYFNADRHHPDTIYSRWGGFLDDVAFDPLRYGIPPAALPSIEASQLLTLEVVRQALQDAGYLDRELPRERTSVILGAGSVPPGDLGLQYGVRATLPMIEHDGPSPGVLQQLPEWTEDSFPGILSNVIAGRVANRFDFGGVNFTVDAACASSLAAVYLAARELTSGSSDVVIAGGVDTGQNPLAYLCFSKTQALSPRGRCRAFDASADGIAISEGLAAVVLKRLADAERDGDRIYAVIKGVAGASDGRDRSLTAPRPQGQARVLERAYAHAGISPATVGLIEAHGTGTAVGDATEVASLTEVFRKAGASRSTCALGSVKSMIGHTKNTAGVAGLIKAALALHHKVLPPTLHVERPNPRLEVPESPFFVNTETIPWVAASDGTPRRAGVSAFGFGGVNSHAVLEEYQGECRGAAPAGDAIWPAELFLWDAPLAEALDATLAVLERSLGRGARPALRDLAAAVCLRGFTRAGGQHLAIVASSVEDLVAKLANARARLQGSSATGTPGVYLSSASDVPGTIAFLLPGQGSQRLHMLRDLAVRFGDVRQSVERASRALAGQFPQPLHTYIYPPSVFDEDARERQRLALTDTHVAQPSLAAVEAGAVALLARLGIRPDMTAGHSFGEYVALWAAGVLDESALFSIAETRGRVMKESLGAEAGTMAAVHASAGDISAARDGLPPGVWLANFNSPRQTVIAGEVSAVDEAMRRLAAAGIKSQRIPVACAFHSPLMQGSQARFAEALSAMRWRPAKAPVFSNTHGARYPDDPAAIGQVLGEHLIRPVRFADEITAMHDAGARVFLEVGPGTTLATLARDILAGRDGIVVSIDGPGDGLVHFLHTLGQLAVHGVALDVDALFRGRVTERIDLNRLASASTEDSRASTAWWVNGGRVRAAGAKAVATDRKETLSMDKPRSTISEPAGSSRAPEAPVTRTGEEEVMDRFQQVMRQFLDTQATVMSAFLQGRPLEATAVRPSSIAAASLVPSFEKPALPEAPRPVATVEPDPGTQVSEPDRESPGVEQRLLRIVSDRTGYPMELLGLDLDLEADLGIDSIKRVEILGTLQRQAPEAEQSKTQALMDRLTRLKTLRELSNALQVQGDARETAIAAKAPIVAPRRLEMPVPPSSTLPRMTLTTTPAPLVAGGSSLVPGRVSVITDDGRGIAGEVAGMLRAHGERPVVLRPGAQASAIGPGVYEADVTDPDSVAHAVDGIRREYGPIAAVLHLLPLSSCRSVGELTLDEWRARVDRDIKSFYALVRAAQHDFEREGRTRAFVAVATSMGGSFGATPSQLVMPTHAGVVAMAKTLVLELPARGKAIDLDPAEAPSVLARRIFDEMASGDPAFEVGYPGGRRVTLEARHAPCDARDDAWATIDSDAVVLLTGGAKGITAEIAHALTERVRPTLIVAGRAPEPFGDEPVETASIEDPQRLKTALAASLRRSNPGVRPAEVQRAWRELLGRREIAGNLARLRRFGGRVIYRQVDVRDEAAFGGLIDQIYEQFGRLDVVVHGAGIVEDRLIGDKTPESFDRVVHTKADSIFLLARRLRPESLKVLALMSSVAATFGNRGQCDYAAANGVLNGFAVRLAALWPGRVVALNWGPWSAAGMASPAIQAQFRTRGVTPISAADGVRATLRELASPERADAIVIWGEGPWCRQAREEDEIETGLKKPA